METLLQDVRYALVSMKRNKGFTTAGLLTLALGIGATTAVFSVVYGVLWRPLPYPEPQRLVRLSEEHEGAVLAAAGADVEQHHLSRLERLGADAGWFCSLPHAARDDRCSPTAPHASPARA